MRSSKGDMSLRSIGGVQEKNKQTQTETQTDTQTDTHTDIHLQTQTDKRKGNVVGK